LDDHISGIAKMKVTAKYLGHKELVVIAELEAIREYQIIEQTERENVIDIKPFTSSP
jgi:hypothetical protein